MLPSKVDHTYFSHVEEGKKPLLPFFCGCEVSITGLGWGNIPKHLIVAAHDSQSTGTKQPQSIILCTDLPIVLCHYIFLNTFILIIQRVKQNFKIYSLIGHWPLPLKTELTCTLASCSESWRSEPTPYPVVDGPSPKTMVWRAEQTNGTDASQL